MDRAARRPRGRQTLTSPRTRRRAADPPPSDEVVVLDDAGGGGGGDASSSPVRSCAAAAPPAGSVATRTRSRRIGLWAVEAEAAPRRKRRRRKSAAVVDAGGGSEGAAGSRSPSNDGRVGCSWGASELAAGCFGDGKDEEAEGCGDEVEVSRVGGDERDGSGSDASDAEKEHFCSGDTSAVAQENEIHCRGGDEDGIEDHCGNGEVRIADVMNAVVTAGVDVVQADGNKEGSGGNDLNVDEAPIANDNEEHCGITKGDRTREHCSNGEVQIVDVMNEVVVPGEDYYDDEELEEKLVGDVIRAYSNGDDLDVNGVGWEADDEMELADDDWEEEMVGDVIRAHNSVADMDANGVGWKAEDEMELADDDVEEKLVGDVIRAYSNLGDSNANRVDWEAEDEMETADDDAEEKMVGDVIRAYSNVGDLDNANGVDWEAEDELKPAAADAVVMADGEEGGMSKLMNGNFKVEMEALEDHKSGGGGVKFHENEEESIKDEIEGKREGALDFDHGTLPIEILDSDEEIKVLNNGSNGPKGRAVVQAKIPIVASCVAWRTRSSWGINHDRFSYSNYFEALSDEPKEDDDDTEVELDDEDDDENDDDDDDDYENDEEEEEEEKEEAERRRRKKGIDTSDDEKTDAMVRYGFEWEDDEDGDVEIIEPLNFEKDGGRGSVGLDMIAQQQKRSRFTWELERKKKMQLGMMTKRRLYERNLDSESDSSGSGRKGNYGLQGEGGHLKVKKKKKHLSSKAGKKSSHSAMLKRQSLMKLLIDTMCGDKGTEISPFDQNPRIEYNVKDLHPLVFSFGDEDPILADRSKHDAALDMLWADFDFALESENIGTYYDDEGQEQGCNALDLAITPVTSCSRGKHQFIIDEQIGIRCKFCSLVNLEIRFILPSLMSSFADKPAWRNASSVKNALMYHDLYERVESSDGQSYSSHLYGTVWDLIPGVITTMYQHQREAFEFMWTNLVGDIRLDELKHGAKPDVVGGCVICHAPGTGKTRLAIVFIQTYMKVFPDCRPVIIAPRGMLFAWEEEFKKWNIDVPFHIMNTAEFSGREDRNIRRLIKKEHRTEKVTRLVKLLSWNKGHGILGISYGLYKNLTSDKYKCSEENKVRSILLENPGLLVLDEGHTPRNERSVIWKTLGKVKTEKRIILSGTPFQNNFIELYNILCLVRPKFGEMFLTKTRVGRRHISKKERDMFSDKYEKGVWASLTSNVTDDNAEKVRSILKPFVHIHNGNILRTLPGLRECVIILKPLPLQKSIIKKVENIGSGNNFEHEYVISLASIHPTLVTAINMSEEEASLIDKPMLEKLRSNPYEGVKTRFVVEVVRLCEALREKVLIFSQFIQPLELIKEHLRKFFKWREGKEILQMDGKILPRYRQASIDAFNDPESDARVLLASTRACCEGISLTGASRVVLLDVVWNPAVGRQAISRAFRIGQQKYVYTYNLITYGTGEGDKYDRQAEKDHLSKLVFSTEDEFNNVRNMLSKTEMEHSSKLISEDKVLEEMTSHDQLKGMFLKIYYPPTESNIVYTYNQMATALS